VRAQAHFEQQPGTFMQSESSLSAARLSSMTFSQSLRFLWQKARLVRSAACQGQQLSTSMQTSPLEHTGLVARPEQQHQVGKSGKCVLHVESRHAQCITWNWVQGQRLGIPLWQQPPVIRPRGSQDMLTCFSVTTALGVC
jgi:hypothetical protein